MGKLIGKLKDSNKNTIITIAMFTSFAVGIIILVIGMTIYKYRIAKLGFADSFDNQEYQYHYVVISEQLDEPFWDFIYQGASEKGKEQGALVEKLGSNLSVSYSLEELMEIAIVSEIDGIILEPNGETAITELINRADKAGIPVITVLKDDSLSRRKSFVGINSYNLGQAYGEQIIAIAGSSKRDVVVLLNGDSKDTSTNIIYSGIRDTVSEYNITLEAAKINRNSTFGSEEDIRKIIMEPTKAPDILVCLTAMDTLYAYQAVVDYNKVGQIAIVGYFDSELILRAVEKEIIYATMAVDAKQVGAYCVDALTEYKETKRVSNYFPVDISVINKDKIEQYLESLKSPVME